MNRPPFRPSPLDRHKRPPYPPKPKPPKPPETMERRKAVTIAVGFHCTDGIVVGADTEVTGDRIKLSQSKVTVISHPKSKAVITGAGISVHIELAVKLFTEQLWKVEAPLLSDMEKILKAVVKEVHEEHIYKIPVSPNGNPDPIYLIAGMWSERQGLYSLLTSAGTPVLDVPDKVSVGYGGELADYLTDHFWEPGLERGEAIHLCAYILEQAKEYVPFCGKKSEIVAIDDEGNLRYDEVQKRTSHLDAFFADFGRVAQPLFYQAPNIDLSEDDFERLLGLFRIEMARLRKQQQLLFSEDVRRKERLRDSLAKLNQPDK